MIMIYQMSRYKYIITHDNDTWRSFYVHFMLPQALQNIQNLQHNCLKTVLTPSCLPGVPKVDCYVFANIPKVTTVWFVFKWGYFVCNIVMFVQMYSNKVRSSGKLHYPTDVCGPLYEEELEYWGLDTNQVIQKDKDILDTNQVIQNMHAFWNCPN